METELKSKLPTPFSMVETFDDLQRVAMMFSKSGLFKDASDVAKAGVKIMAGLLPDLPYLFTTEEK